MFSITMFVIFISALFFAILNLTTAAAHFISCSEPFYLEVQKQDISHCKKLTTLGAEFGWTYTELNDSHQIKIIIGTRLHYASDFRWLAWGVNPGNRPQMVGTRAIIGIRQLDGPLNVSTYNITSYTKLGCKLQPSTIDIEVSHMKLDFLTTINYFILQATVILPSSVYNISRLNHVWQVGFDADEMEPKMHPTALQNVDSTETIDLKHEWGRHVGKHVHRLRMVHGIVNIVGWGTILPAGVIVARYSKYPLEWKTSWYALHIGCQIVGYIIGTSGWIIGLLLGHASRDYVFRTHRMFAIFIFTFTTLQMLALQLKPKKSDDYRKYWNMYHHFLGYALLAVISINIFHGINILKPDNSWKWAYIAILGMFALVVMALEVYTWTKFVHHTDKNSTQNRQSTSDQNSAGAVPSPGN